MVAQWGQIDQLPQVLAMTTFALAGLAILTRTELLAVILGGIFVLETLSVMIQVTWFKTTKRFTGTGRRVFRIAPIHHHFEMLGWEQVTVVVDGDSVTSDAAGLAGAKVTAEILAEIKGPKIRILKFKNKTGYRRRQGHRQRYTQVKVTGIES